MIPIGRGRRELIIGNRQTSSYGYYLSKQDSKYFVSTKWVIDVDVKVFFGQISYQCNDSLSKYIVLMKSITFCNGRSTIC
jgi:hypothetical protein